MNLLSVRQSWQHSVRLLEEGAQVAGTVRNSPAYLDAQLVEHKRLAGSAGERRKRTLTQTNRSVGGVPQQGSSSVRRGLAYQRKVENWVTREAAERDWALWVGPWLATPVGICQPDFVLDTGKRVLILESKLTYVDCAGQLGKYKEAVERALEGVRRSDIIGVQVCRRLTPDTPREKIVHTLEAVEAVQVTEAAGDNAVLLLWI